MKDREIRRTAEGRPAWRRAWPVIAGLAFLSSPALCREDTAHLVIRKLVIPSERVRVYIVKKGDWVSGILRREKITGSRRLSQLKALNPDIRDLNRIYPGQVLRLPGPDDEKAADALPAPGEPAAEVRRETIDRPAVPPPEAEIVFLRHVIHRMQGQMITAGQYFLPLGQIGQVAIDCARMPVVELAEGATLILDYGRRLPAPVVQTIAAQWKNHHVLSIAGGEDPLAVLQRIASASRTFSIFRRGKPVEAGKSPPVHLSGDWLLTKSNGTAQPPYRHILSRVDGPSQCLPHPVRSYAEREGLRVTEYLAGWELASAPETPPSAQDTPAIRETRRIDIAGAVLALFGLSPERDREIVQHDAARNGFRLSIRADILVHREGRRLLVIGKPLPEPFREILREHGTDILVLDEGDTKADVIAKTLEAANIPAERGRFVFPANEFAPARGFIELHGILVRPNGKDTLLVDADLDPGISGLLHALGKVSIVRY